MKEKEINLIATIIAKVVKVREIINLPLANVEKAKENQEMDVNQHRLSTLHITRHTHLLASLCPLAIQNSGAST